MGTHSFPQRAQVRDALIHMPIPISPRVPWRDAGTTETSGLQNIQCLMNMRIDTSGHDRPIAQINNKRRGWTTDCWRDIGNDTILDQDFGRPGERIV
jgi:hypothetical protein